MSRVNPFAPRSPRRKRSKTQKTPNKYLQVTPTEHLDIPPDEQPRSPRRKRSKTQKTPNKYLQVTPTELDIPPDEQTQKTQNKDLQVTPTGHLDIPSDDQERPDVPLKEPSLEETWDEIKNLNEAKGEPRVIVSVLGAYNHTTSMLNFKDNSLMTKALQNVVRQAGKCGFLFHSDNFSFMANVTGHTGHLEIFKELKYQYARGFKSTKSTEDDLESTERENHDYPKKSHQQKDISIENFHEKLLRVETHINREAKVPFHTYDQISRNDNHKLEVRVAVAILVINGDLHTLEHVKMALDDNISVVVVKGSGGVADLIACFLERKSKLRSLSLLLPKASYDDVKKLLKSIRGRELMISIFDLKKDNTEILWNRLSDGILKAWSIQGENAENGDILKNMIDIDGLSKDEIFGGFILDRDNPKNILVYAIQKNNPSIAREVVNGNVKDIALSDVYTEILKQNSGSGNILQKIYQKGYEELRTGEITTEEMKSDDKMKTDEMKTDKMKTDEMKTEETKTKEKANKYISTIINKLLKGCFFSTNACSKCCKVHADSNPIDNLLQVSVLCNHVGFAREFWIKSEHPMLTTLISSCVLDSLAEHANKMFDDSLQEKLTEHSKKFSKRAESLLQKLNKVDNTLVSSALYHVTGIWGYDESLIHFVQQFHMKEFVSHTLVQKDASERLYAYPKIKTNAKPDLKREEERAQQEEDKSGKTVSGQQPEFSLLAFFKFHRATPCKIVTAPITRLAIHAVMFITVLIMFSIFLTTEFRSESISGLEVFVFIFMLGDFIEEMYSMLRPRDGKWSVQRILLHLLDLWNILDVLSFVLFSLGFTMHLFTDGNNSTFLSIRRLYSVCLFVMFLRIQNLLLLSRRFGIIIIMVKEMMKDLFNYLVILCILICAAGVVYQANIYPNRPFSEFTSHGSFLKIPYWQVYGELYLDTIEGSNDGCTNNETLWKNGNMDRCPNGDWLTSLIAVFYMMLTNLLLLNIVIAMFSARFDRIMENSEQKWRFNRHSVILTYENWIPSPFNLVLRILRIPRQSHKACLRCNQERKGNKDMLKKQRELAKEIIDEEINEDEKKKENEEKGEDEKK